MKQFGEGDVMEEQVCCPRFDPEPWDEKVLEWNEKRFIKDRVFTFLYMPFGFGKVMRALDGRCEALAPPYRHLCLSDHTSKWNMDVYLSVDQDIPCAQNVTLDGNFLCKVYEGPYRNTGMWCKDFEGFVKSQNAAIEKWYMWYTTCPKCAKKYGKNYVVFVAQMGDGN